MTTTQQSVFQVYCIIVMLNLIWILVDQIQGYVQMFRAIYSEQEDLVPFERRYIRRHTLVSLIYPLFVLEVFAPTPILGLYHWSLYALAILTAFPVYAIYIVVSNYRNVDKFLEFDGNISFRVMENPFELRAKINSKTIVINNSTIKEVIITRPIVAGPPNNMFGIADFRFNDSSALRVTLLTIGDQTYFFKRHFKKKLKSKRSWKPIDPYEGW